MAYAVSSIPPPAASSTRSISRISMTKSNHSSSRLSNSSHNSNSTSSKNLPFKRQSAMAGLASASSRRPFSIPTFPQPPTNHVNTTQQRGGSSSGGASVSGGAGGGGAAPAAGNKLMLKKLPRSKTASATTTTTASTTTSSSPSSFTTVTSSSGNRASSSASSSHISRGPAGRHASSALLTGDSREVASRFNVSTPTMSRSSSSAHGSSCVTATTFDDDGAAAAAANAAAAQSKGMDPYEMSSSSKKDPKKESKGNVLVSVRVRPDSNKSDAHRPEGDWYVDGRRSVVSYRGKDGGDYYYDNVFTTHDDNARVYDSSAKRLVRRVMEGYHGTVFAYGMTGTGKTFSMQGTASSPGVIPLAITDIFSYIRETPHREFLLRVSYLEIYNEKIHDLLAPPPASNGLGIQPQQEEIKLREDSKRGVYATPLKEEIVQSPTQLLRVIARGDQNRRVGSTQFNARSSRSHAVVQIVVESRERAGSGSDPASDRRSVILPGGVRVSTLSLIDLAGSERAAETKERRTEGAHINKSLLTLGTVISRLSETKDKNGNQTDRDGRHLPYRDSKLTRLLQPALSGNSLVSILCTIQIGYNGTGAPANTHILETLNTLKFASRAKNNIVSNARKADESLGAGGGDAGSRALLERYRLEIASLKGQLDSQAKQFSERESQLGLLEERLLARESEREYGTRHEEQLLEMQLARTALKERIEHLNRLILSSQSNGVNMSGSFDRLPGAHSDSSSRSARSSVSTLGAPRRPLSVMSPSAAGFPNQRASALAQEEDDTIGEYADGMASMQLQIKALHADLADKNRYISTLERRLLQARRSSHSRMSMGFSHSRSHGSSDDGDIDVLLHERDMEISELRIQLDDKDRMLTALRSAARQRDMAFQTASEPFIGGDGKRRSTASYGGTTVGAISPTSYTSSASAPAKQIERDSDIKRHSVDTVSRMLDEMIEDRVDNVRTDEEADKRASSTGRNSTFVRPDRASRPASSTAIPISSILRKPPRKSMGPADMDPSVRIIRTLSRKSFTSDSENGFILKPVPPVPPIEADQFHLTDARPSPLSISQRSSSNDIKVSSG